VKVLQLDVHYSGSSTGKLVASLTGLLRTRGHEVLALYGRGRRHTKPGERRIASSWEFLLHVLAARVTGWNGIYSFLATRRFLAELHSFEPDVVHLHELHGYYINIFRVMYELKRLDIPTVWTFHCEFMYTGKCGHAMDCEKWKTECHHCPQLDEYPKSWGLDFTRAMFRQKKRAFDGFDRLVITSPSEWLSRRVRQSMLAGRPVHTVFNGIDVNVFQPRDVTALRQELAIPNDAAVVLSVGADLLSLRKGGHWALQLAQRLSGKPMVLVMVGVEDIPKQCPDNVRMLAPVRDQSRLAEFYSLGDVLLLTSEKETFSLVCAESLACGTPVIGFDSGAPKEVAPQGYGVFVPYGDLDALEQQVLAYLENPALLEAPQQCVAFARRRYADTVMVSQFEELYHALIDHKTAGGPSSA
jgi:glycosyltransferase involved in cell wall biosynthesis